MKRISSALIVALAALSAGTVAPAMAQTSQQAPAKGGIQLADDAPDSYTVVKGDSLWGISSRFLKTPWRWPEVWKLNAEEIKNPHLIYPGQTIYLDRNNMTLSLKAPGDVVQPDGTIKLAPRIYDTAISGPITSLTLQNIQQFLVEPLVIDEADPAGAGRVIGIQEDRVLAGPAETFFARGLSPDQPAWTVFRPGKPIRDPINAKQILGYEAVLVANARVTTAEQAPVAAAMQVITAKHEVTTGDRLLPSTKETVFAYAPHAAPDKLHANIATVYGGVSQTGPYGVITINAGRDKGMEPGHVIALSRVLGKAVYRGAEGGERAQEIPLPDERYGLAFVFRVFNKMSYALVLESSRTVIVGDKAGAP
ncbi:MAG: LysM peptidoglycan-binding domain-containing protein [Rhodocyclaceae bacterium]